MWSLSGDMLAIPEVMLATICSLLLAASSQHTQAQNTDGSTGGGGEYCAWDTFNATCPSGSAVFIQHALYGRMELGKCIHNDWGHLGCSSDVLTYVDRICSGRQTCEMKLPDEGLVKILGSLCPRDLGAYLEVSYICLPVETIATESCSTNDPIILNSTSGYLSNHVTSSASLDCPWIIKGHPGQTVQLKLMDFGVWKPRVSGQRSGSGGRRRRPTKAGICHMYGEIEEPSTGSSITVCGGKQREEVVYQSDTAEVKVHLANPGKESDPVYYLIHYEVQGCADPGPYPAASVRRREHTATVTCDERDQEWKLTCIQGTWQGSSEAGNCSLAGASWGLSHFIENTLSLPQGVLIVLILGIAVMIAFIIFAIGFLSLKRRRQNEQAIPLPLDDSEDKFSRQSSYAKEQYPMLAKPERLTVGRESDYATTLQRRLAVPPGAISPSVSEHHFPMSSSFSECGTCPIHGNYSQVDKRPYMSTFKPNANHIYESPKFERREPNEVSEECSTPFYHELEPDAAQFSPTFTPMHCFVYNPDSPT